MSVGFGSSASTVAVKDLRLEWRTWEALSSSLIFSIVVLVVFNFAFGDEAVRLFGAERVIPGVLWTVIAFASLVVLSRSLQLERLRDTISALFLAPVDRGSLYLGKLLANLVKLTILQWLLLPLSIVLFDYPVAGRLGALTAILALHGLGLCELGTLFAAVTVRVGRGEALLGILLFPAVSPLLISAVECTSAVIEGRPLGSVAGWMFAAAGFDMLYLLIGLLTFEFVLEE